MKNDRIDYKRKDKILTGSVITSAAILLGLYLNNGTVVKADSLPAGTDTAQTANSATENSANQKEDSTSSSTSQNENSITGNGTANGAQAGTSGSANQNETSATTAMSEGESSLTASRTNGLTRSEKNYTWNGLNLTFDTETGELKIPGGTDANPVVLRDPTPLCYLPYDEIFYFKKITITGKIKIVGSAVRFLAFIPHVTEISGLENLDTSEVKNMSVMFGGCPDLTSLDLSYLNTTNVTDTSYMFNGSKKLTSLDLSQFNKDKLTNIAGMFYDCAALTTVDVSQFKTAKVTDMSCMFSGCSSLTSIDLSNFITDNVTNMNNMFSNCSALTKLDLSKFVTNKVTDMSYMFYSCEHLAKLNISNFDMRKAYDSRNAMDEHRTVGFLKGLPNLSVLALGPNCILQNAGLTESVVKSSGTTLLLNPTSKWQNVADGTINEPNGNKVWAPADMERNYNGSVDHDTYVRSCKVRVHYQDEDGNEIAGSKDIRGVYGEEYPKASIPGYTFKEVQGDTTGTYEDTPKEVTMVYTKNPDSPVTPSRPIVQAKVTVHYQDENGKGINPDEVLTGQIGDGYQTKQKSIAGYKFKEVSGNATGFFTAVDQTVTYIYTKDDEETTTTKPVMPVKPVAPANPETSTPSNRPGKENKNQTKGHKNQISQKAKQNKKAESLPEETKPKADPLPQTGASQESNGIMAAIGGILMAISAWGGAWLKRRQQ